MPPSVSEFPQRTEGLLVKLKLAPTAGLAPAKTDLKDLSRDDFAFVGFEKKWRNAEDMLLRPHDGGTISLAPSPGALVRLAFHDG